MDVTNTYDIHHRLFDLLTPYMFHFAKAAFSLIFLYTQFNIYIHAYFDVITIDMDIVSIGLSCTYIDSPMSSFWNQRPRNWMMMMMMMMTTTTRSYLFTRNEDLSDGQNQEVCCRCVRRVARRRNLTACGPACAMAAGGIPFICGSEWLLRIISGFPWFYQFIGDKHLEIWWIDWMDCRDHCKDSDFFFPSLLAIEIRTSRSFNLWLQHAANPKMGPCPAE